MSLSEGETICMRHPETGFPGYFVVFKLDNPQTIWFIPHWDARLSKEKDGYGKREEIDVTAANLKMLEPEKGVPPYKVRVSPLGEAIARSSD